MSKSYAHTFEKAIKFGAHPAYDSFFKDNTYYAYAYAKDVLKGPFPLGELAICEDAEYSYYYARDVLKSRFKLFEKYIDQKFFFFYNFEYTSPIEQYLIGIIGFNHD